MRSLFGCHLEGFHNVFEDGRDVDRVRVVGVLSFCDETEDVLTEPLDVFPLLGESAVANEPKGVAIDGDGCFGGLLDEGLELWEGFWIPALDELFEGYLGPFDPRRTELLGLDF